MKAMRPAMGETKRGGISLIPLNEFLTLCSVPEDNSCIEILSCLALKETPGERCVHYTPL